MKRRYYFLAFIMLLMVYISGYQDGEKRGFRSGVEATLAEMQRQLAQVFPDPR